MPKIHNIVLSGGGMSVYGMVGALVKLDGNRDYCPKRVAGTSGGSLLALLVSLKFNGSEIQSELHKLDFSKIADASNMAEKAYNLAEIGSIYRGTYLRHTLEGFLEKRNLPTNTTFGNLREQGFLDLYVVTTKVYKRDGKVITEPKIFSYENAARTAIIPALMASAAIPGFFPAVYLAQHPTTPEFYFENNCGMAHIDGGDVDNYAIDIFDHPRYLENPTDEKPSDDFVNPETLGLRMSTTAEIKDVLGNDPVIEAIPREHLLTLLFSVGAANINQGLNKNFGAKENTQRTIFIDRKDIAATDFNINDKKKALLEKSGEEGYDAKFVATPITFAAEEIINIPTLALPPVQRQTSNSNKAQEYTNKPVFVNTTFQPKSRSTTPVPRSTPVSKSGPPVDPQGATCTIM